VAPDQARTAPPRTTLEHMLTAPARRARAGGVVAVTSLSGLERDGWTAGGARAQLAALRWQRFGRAIVRHNGKLSRAELCDVALVNCGPRAMLTSFTALERAGLKGWEREAVHVLVPRGARIRRAQGVPLRVHYTDSWPDRTRPVQIDRVPRAAVLAAAAFSSPRPACGVLAAVVQQRLARAEDLVTALQGATRTRHRAGLLAAAHDIAQGAQALSEIDFVRLCRDAGLPPPEHQAVRLFRGRRRYLDAQWTRSDGRRVVAEVDGALHLLVQRWWDDQLRQNELVIADDLVLRFPTVAFRHESEIVIDQLRRMLRL
jgi:hypothetical protein